MGSSRIRSVVIIASLTSVYLIAARLGLLLAFEHTNISPVWPPTGVALAAFLVFGWGTWPAITLGAFLANYTTGLPIGISGIVSIGNTLEAIFGFFLIRHFCNGRNPFEGASDTFRFLFCSAICTTVSATIGTGAIVAGGLPHEASYAYLWWIWWLGDTVGAIVVTPFILAWSRTKIRWKRFGEAAPVFVLLIVISFVVFSGLFRIGGPLVYATVPVVVLAAFRFQQHGASTALFLLSTIAIIGTIRGHGPFAGNSPHESLLILQSFVGVIAATALPVSAVVTERKRIEEINRSQLKEKEILLQEIHHRVKNNLQIISSLLEMQLTHSDPIVRNLLMESRNRIYSMALIHERLYESDSFERINLGHYLKDLVTQVFHSYATAKHQIEIKIDCDDAYVGIDRAVPVGLIVNEIVSNSLKHAFQADQSGEVVIQLRCPDGRIILNIGDNGVGLPPDLDFEHSKTMGLRLISILTKQLHAEVQIDRSEGTHFVIEFGDSKKEVPPAE